MRPMIPKLEAKLTYIELVVYDNETFNFLGSQEYVNSYTTVLYSLSIQAKIHNHVLVYSYVRVTL